MIAQQPVQFRPDPYGVAALSPFGGRYPCRAGIEYGAGHDVVRFEHSERKLDAAGVATTLLVTKQGVLVLAAGHQRVDVGTLCRRP